MRVKKDANIVREKGKCMKTRNQAIHSLAVLLS